MENVLLLAEKGLILFTVVPVGVGYLSIFPHSAALWGAGRGRAMVGAADPDWPMAGSFHTM